MNITEKGSVFIVILGYVYFFISQIMTIYFLWQWIQVHGFWSSILYGIFLAEFKGLLWIFYIW